MRPILFNTDMVRAILSGSKTVTRRICRDANKLTVPLSDTIDHNARTYTVEGINEDGITQYLAERRMPYAAGDILWVRETWAKAAPDIYACKTDNDRQVPRWHPSIHMPKEAARLFLRVTDVRLERLREISEEQAQREGIRLQHEDFTRHTITGKPNSRATDGRPQEVRSPPFGTARSGRQKRTVRLGRQTVGVGDRV